MFGLGMWELMVILALALIFLGPAKLPGVATTLGKAIRSFRKATSDLQDQLEVDESVKQPFRELKAALRDEPAPAKTLDQVRPATATAPATVNAAAVAEAPKAAEAPTVSAPKADAPTADAPKTDAPKSDDKPKA